MYETAVSAKRSVSNVEEKEVVEEKVDTKKIIINILKFILGAAGIVLGADLLVENAICYWGKRWYYCYYYCGNWN